MTVHIETAEPRDPGLVGLAFCAFLMLPSLMIGALIGLVLVAPFAGDGHWLAIGMQFGAALLAAPLWFCLLHLFTRPARF